MSTKKKRNPNSERYKNFMLYKVWATDKEMEHMLPFISKVFIVATILALILGVLSAVLKD